MRYLQNVLSNLNGVASDNKNYWLMLIAGGLPVIIFFWYQISNNPNVYYLSDSGDTHWIMEPSPFDVVVKKHKREVKLFKTSFTVPEKIQNITLTIKAFKFFNVFIDENLVYESDTIPDHWKRSHQVEVSGLTPGNHEVVISVMNYDGPVSVFAYSNDVPLKTDSSWVVKTGENEWSAVRLAADPQSSAISTQFQPAYKKLIISLPLGILACFLVFGIIRLEKIKKNHVNTANLRWLLIGSWVVFTINSMINTKIEAFDWGGRVSYIQYILIENRLPLATDGWQMFQSPLFYIICANLVKFLTYFFSVEESVLLLRLIPLLCGIALIEICYRCACVVFQDREDLQSIVLLIAAMMPMNLYMSQYFGNETLLAVFTAACIFVLLKWVNCPELAVSGKQQILLGFLLGLALLTKVTALILVGITFLTLAVVQYSSSNSIKSIVVSGLRVLAVIAVVAGWYYLRNWIFLGKPFYGGWDPERGALLAWWQDPGFRHIANFTGFGQALIYPIYSATHTFWDGFYSTIWSDGLLGAEGTYESRPPWNYTYVLATVWLSLVPTAGLLVAVIAPFSKKYFTLPNKSTLIFCVFCIFLYVIAIIYLYLKLPTYSTVKASYSLGLLPCYAILISFGLSRFMENNISKQVIISILVWWGLSSYIGYFSLGVAN